MASKTLGKLRVDLTYFRCEGASFLGQDEYEFCKNKCMVRMAQHYSTRGCSTLNARNLEEYHAPLMLGHYCKMNSHLVQIITSMCKSKQTCGLIIWDTSCLSIV